MLLNPASQQKSKLNSWGHWFTASNTLPGLLLMSIYWWAQPLPDSLPGLVYMLAYTIGHAGFIFFVVNLLLLFPVTLLNKPSIARFWGAFVAATGLTLLLIDALVYSVYAYHINLSSFDYIASDIQLLTDSLPAGFIVALILFYVAMLAVQLVLANAVWRNLDKFRRFYINIRALPVALVCFLSAHLVHIWADLNFYQPITQQDNMLPLSQPLTAKTILSKSGLLDIDEYQQKKQFSFDVNSFALSQNQQRFSCFAPDSSVELLVINSRELSVDRMSQFIKISDPALASTQYFAPNNLQDNLFEILTGLPAIYRKDLNRGGDNLLDAALLSTNTSANLDSLPIELLNSLPEFRSVDKISGARLQVSLLEVNNTAQIAPSLRSTGKQIIVLLPQSASQYGQIFVRGELVQLPPTASNLDIMPTLIEGWLSCSFQQDYIKFGQNLFSVPKDPAWLVTANEHNIYVLYQQTLTQIASNAQVSSVKMQSEETAETPPNAILVRALNYLKRQLVNKQANSRE
ncbi:DUF3413 domain-containing protein [Gayadomonas joobiniege]|uniref:DUF3413 domain-containing protein n=1 Tax=Gayadomonas joobiniege TaxID=1234606 RepID=UPI00036432C6|nr:DUF3413 domain-containing protein [Gayadomonas joobiniege]